MEVWSLTAAGDINGVVQVLHKGVDFIPIETNILKCGNFLLTILWSQGALKQLSYKEGQSKALSGGWFTGSNQDSMILRNKCILFLEVPSRGKGQMASDLVLFEAANPSIPKMTGAEEVRGTYRRCKDCCALCR